MLLGMEMKEVNIEITFQVTEGTHQAYSSWENPERARAFLPETVKVDRFGRVSVTGCKVKKNGQPSAVDMTIQYWRGDGYERSQPEFVKQARRLARDFYSEAMNAWETREIEKG